MGRKQQGESRESDSRRWRPPSPSSSSSSSQRQWLSSAVGGSAHLVPGALRLPVKDGAQAPEAGVRPHLHPVGRRPRRRGRGRGGGRGLDRADVIGGVVGPSPPQVGQVGETQLLWLRRAGGREETGKGESQRDALKQSHDQYGALKLVTGWVG